MSLHEKIAELIDEEVDQRLVGMMNEYVEIISKKHGISLDLLLKDIPNTFSVRSVRELRGMMVSAAHLGLPIMDTADTTLCKQTVSYVVRLCGQIVITTDQSEDLLKTVQVVNFQKSL